MKWAAAKQNDKRIKRKFAWFPTKLVDETMIWFELYFIEQTYIINMWGEVVGWQPTKRFQFENLAQEMLARKAGEIK